MPQSDRLFDLPDEKRKKAPKPVRARRGHDHLYRVAFGLQAEYVYANDEATAIYHWNYKHPALTPDDAKVNLVSQEDLDTLETTDPKLFRRIRSL